MTANKHFGLNIAPHASLALTFTLNATLAFPLTFTLFLSRSCLFLFLSELTALDDQMQVENPVPV